MSNLHFELGEALKSIGAPGDYGYETEFGKALFKLYQLHTNYSERRSDFTPAPVPKGTRVVNGKTEMRNAKGGYDPIEVFKPQHLAEDKIVRKIAGYFVAASEQVSRLKAHTLEDVDAHEAYLAEKYDAKLGGPKGNKTLKTTDALIEVKVRINDVIDFGAELQTAKALVDECLDEWAAESRPEIRAIITNAFHTDQEGKVNRAEIVRLKRLNIDDARWKRAMDAIKDAERTVSSKAYIYCRMRANHNARWENVTIDMAKA
jgi:hypothetical protein